MIIIKIICQQLLSTIKYMHHQSLLLLVAVRPSHPVVSSFGAKSSDLIPLYTPSLAGRLGAEQF